MELLEGIHQRHSIGKLGQEEPPRSEIETLLEAAIQAPNHHLTEPWRFFVVSGSSRDELGALMERLLIKRKPDSSDEERARERAKPLRAPILIAAVSLAGRDSVETTENFAATAAAVENLLLAASARGLAAQWRTGDIAYSPEMKQWLVVPDDASVVAIVYLGYANMEPHPRRRTSAAEITEWRR